MRINWKFVMDLVESLAVAGVGVALGRAAGYGMAGQIALCAAIEVLFVRLYLRNRHNHTVSSYINVRVPNMFNEAEIARMITEMRPEIRVTRNQELP